MLIVIDTHLQKWIQYLEQKGIPSKYSIPCLDVALWMYSIITSLMMVTFNPQFSVDGDHLVVILCVLLLDSYMETHKC